MSENDPHTYDPPTDRDREILAQLRALKVARFIALRDRELLGRLDG